MAAVDLTGDKQLKRLLRTLGPRIQRKVTRQAINKAANPIIRAAKITLKARVAAKRTTLKTQLRASGMKARQAGRVAKLSKFSKTEGALAKSIGKRMKTYTASGVVFVAVGPKWPQGAHGHLIEYGHKPAGWYAKQKGAKFVPAYPFMRPAFDTQKRNAMIIVVSEHRARVEREAAKAARTGGG